MDNFSSSKMFLLSLRSKGFSSKFKVFPCSKLFREAESIVRFKINKKNYRLQSGREGAMGCTVFITLVLKVL